LIPLRHTGGVEIQLHLFLTLVLDGGKCSTSCPSPVTCGKEPQYPWIGGWVGPRDSLEVLKRKKSLVHAGIQKPDHPVHCLVITPTMLR